MRREVLLAAQAEARRNPGRDVQIDSPDGVSVRFRVDPVTGEEEVVVSRDDGPPSEADIDRVVGCLFSEQEQDSAWGPGTFELKLPRRGAA